ncbi:hypothetical protein CP03DC29_0567B, partial [Chlamydia psittaci 03DC29]
ILK